MTSPVFGEPTGLAEVPGGRVAYWLVAGAGARGIPLLCLHGGPGMTHNYLAPLSALADERPVIFYDQLGCGESDRPGDASLWTVERSVAEVAAVREALGLADLHLFGNSWGGWLALSYVLDRQPALASLTLSSSPPSTARFVAGCDRLRSRLDERTQEVLRRHEVTGYFDCPEYQAAVLTFYQRHLCRLDPWPEGLERSFAGMSTEVYRTMWGPSEFGPLTGTLKGWDVTARLPEIRVPSLLTAGRHDEATPDQMIEMSAAMPDAEVRVFEHSSHLAFYEETDAYLAVLRGFLRRFDTRG